MTRAATFALVALVTLLAIGCSGEEAAPPPGDPTTERAPSRPELETVEPGALTAATVAPSPPFAYREGPLLVGFDVDLVAELADRLGLRLKWVEVGADAIFTQLEAGRFDVVAAAVAITPELSARVAFTRPYFVARQAVAINTEQTPEVRALEDLRPGAVVAVARGGSGERWARENVPAGVQVRSFRDAAAAYAGLDAGRVAAVVVAEASALAERQGQTHLEIVDTVDIGERYAFAVSPENEPLLAELNRVLQDVMDDGTYDEVYERYEALPPGGRITGGG